MIRDIYHVAYLTDDIDAAKTFYVDVLGAQVALEHTSGASGSKMAFIHLGDTRIELIQPADTARLQGRTGLVLDHIGYEVDSIEAEMEQLATKGMAFATAEPIVNPEGARLIYLDAASALGVRIHLTEQPTSAIGAV